MRGSRNAHDTSDARLIGGDLEIQATSRIPSILVWYHQFIVLLFNDGYVVDVGRL